MASLIQFSAIYAFTRLISSLLEQTDVLKRGATVSVSTAVVALRPGKTINSNIDGEHKADPDAKIQRLAGEYKRLVRLGGFLGLWVYIIAGSIRALVTITIAVLLQLRAKMEIEDDKTAIFLENAEVAFEGMTGTAFLLLTVLSVITMVIMSGTYIVTDKIGDANKKFLGARVMLLASEIVPKVVDAFEMGTPLFKQLLPVTQYVDYLHLHREQAELLKVALLNITCLVTVTMNLLFWRDVHIDADDENGLLTLPANDEAAKQMQDVEAPLLGEAS